MMWQIGKLFTHIFSKSLPNFSEYFLLVSMSACSSMGSIWQSSGLSSTAKSKGCAKDFSLIFFVWNLFANSSHSFCTLVQSRSGNSSFLVARHMKWVNVALLNWTWKNSNFFSKAQICSNSLLTSWFFPCSLKFRSIRCCVMSVRNAKSFNQFSLLKKAKFWCLLFFKDLNFLSQIPEPL